MEDKEKIVSAVLAERDRRINQNDFAIEDGLIFQVEVGGFSIVLLTPKRRMNCCEVSNGLPKDDPNWIAAYRLLGLGTEKDENGLLPCPFCGGKATVHFVQDIDDPYFCVCCDHDLCIGHGLVSWMFRENADAAHDWNKRDASPPKSPAALVAALEEIKDYQRPESEDGGDFVDHFEQIQQIAYFAIKDWKGGQNG